MSEFSSTKAVSSSKSVSSSSKVSASSKISSSTNATSSTSTSEMDSLLSKSAAARDSARSLASKLSTDLGDEMEGLMKRETPRSLISSSFDSSSDDPGVSSKSSVKSHSTSSSSKAALSQKTSIVDGVVVAAETAADRSSQKAEAAREKTIEDGVVTLDTGFKKEAKSDAKLRATKEMSGAELDEFFRTPAIAGKTPEALAFDKDAGAFQMKLTDLPQFSPQELTVKIVDGVITVLGSHEEVDAEGTTRRHSYLRRFTVPEGYKSDSEVGWELDSGTGILVIKAGKGVAGVGPPAQKVHLDCTIFKPRSFFKNPPPPTS